MEGYTVTRLNIKHLNVFLRIGYHQMDVDRQGGDSLDVLVPLGTQSTVFNIMSVHDVKVDERAADFLSQLAVIVEFLYFGTHDGR